MAGPQPGDLAPDFELITADREPFRLSGHTAGPCILYFYAEDDTQGCTIENQQFSDALPEFAALGATVVGISPDSVATHCRFRDKFGLAVTLLADPDHVAIDAYGVWGPKVTFGHHLVGLIRTSFLIAPGGRIAERWHVTRINGHAAKVLAATRQLVGSA